MKIQLATEYACKLLKLPVSDLLSYQLADAETTIAAMLNRYEPFSDPKSPKVTGMRQALADINRMFEFLTEHDMISQANKMEELTV